MMLTVEKRSNEEEAIDILTEIENKKQSLLDFVRNQHGEFSDKNNSIRELCRQFDAAHESAVTVIEETEQISETLAMLTEEKHKYSQQIESLNLLRTTVVDLQDLESHVQNLRVIADSPLPLSINGLGEVERELTLAEEAVARPSMSLLAQESRVFKTVVRSLAETKGRLRDRATDLWEGQVAVVRDGPQTRVSFGLSRGVVRAVVRLLGRLQVAAESVRPLCVLVAESLVLPAVTDGGRWCLVCQETEAGVRLSLEPHSERDSLAEKAVHSLEGLSFLVAVLEEDLTITAALRRELFLPLLTSTFTEAFLPRIFPVRHEVVGRLLDFAGCLEGHWGREEVQGLRGFLEGLEGRVREYEEASVLARGRRVCLLGSLLDEEDCPGGSDLSGGQEGVLDLGLAFRLPKCKVSTMARQLADLVDATVASCTGGDEDAGLLRVLPDLVTLYLSVVPVSSGRQLEDLPQASAMHFNNLMFLAHRCLLLAPAVKSLLGAGGDPSEASFVPEGLLKVVYSLREAASSTLAAEVRKQERQMEDFFEGVDSFEGISSPGRREAAERAIDRSLLHLGLVRRAYLGLPEAVSRGVAGGLGGRILALVTARVLAMADIVRADGDAVAGLLASVRDGLGDLALVPGGPRLLGLLAVLGGGLADVETGFGGGHGPLAAAFSPGELRGLVRALFRAGPPRARLLEVLR